MSVDKYDVTYGGQPRFLSFIELAYLLEALHAAETHFNGKMSSESTKDEIGNINATKQSLYRAAFISAFSIAEQNLDELVRIRAEKLNTKIKPDDLKHRGVNRSVMFAVKVLRSEIDKNMPPWKDLYQLQEIRNHLVHFGSDFNDSKEHQQRIARFRNIKWTSLRPMICFTYSQLQEVINIIMSCVENMNSETDDK